MSEESVEIQVTIGPLDPAAIDDFIEFMAQTIAREILKKNSVEK